MTGKLALGFPARFVQIFKYKQSSLSKIDALFFSFCGAAALN
jgi:hypothetical protein